MRAVNENEEARRPWGLAAFLLLALAAFVALGVWQVHRMGWKHALIARVEARVRAEPVAPPPDARLRTASAEDIEYLRVAMRGRYLGEATTLVRSATDLGTGYWVMTPLDVKNGSRRIWINRGFVPAGTQRAVAAAMTPTGDVSVTGLLRKTEPGGSLLQANDPANDRWYSRDVDAMSKSRSVAPVVPAFVDAQIENAVRPTGQQPVPGLTQIAFPDNHLSYALTWFAMAAMSLMALLFVWRWGRWKD